MDLDKMNIGHCRTIRKVIKKEKKHLSTVVSTCAYYNDATWDMSRTIDDGEYCQGMISKFQKIGGIGNLSSIAGCKNYVGCCAEQHAANAMVKRKSIIGNRYSDIHFSKARRARTLEIVKPCKNCKSLFTF